MEAKLRSGTTLIVDRYSYSGVAFTSAKGLDIEWCKVQSSESCLIMRFQVKHIIVFMQAPEIGLLAPDLVVYLEITPEVIYCF